MTAEEDRKTCSCPSENYFRVEGHKVNVAIYMRFGNKEQPVPEIIVEMLKENGASAVS